MDVRDPKLFRTEKYLTQNIRVNPESSTSGLEHASAYKNNDGRDSDNEDQKYVRDAQHDMEKLRDQVRLRYERYVEKVERDLEEAAKAKQK